MTFAVLLTRPTSTPLPLAGGGDNTPGSTPLVTLVLFPTPAVVALTAPAGANASLSAAGSSGTGTGLGDGLGLGDATGSTTGLGLGLGLKGGMGFGRTGGGEGEGDGEGDGLAFKPLLLLLTGIAATAGGVPSPGWHCQYQASNLVHPNPPTQAAVSQGASAQGNTLLEQLLLPPHCAYPATNTRPELSLGLFESSGRHW